MDLLKLIQNIKYFNSQPWPYPHSLMVGFTADYDSGKIKVDNKEITYAKWFAPDEIPRIPSKMSIARELIDWYVEYYSNYILKSDPLDSTSFLNVFNSFLDCLIILNRIRGSSSFKINLFPFPDHLIFILVSSPFE